MFGNVISFFKKVWEELKRFGKWLLEKILNFVRNIRDFFHEKRRLKLLRERAEVIGVSIKEKLENGNYGVVNCLYDTDTEKVFDMEEAQDVEAEQLDDETIRNFGDKEMIVLQ